MGCTVNGVSKRLRGRVILDNVSAVFSPAQVSGIVGVNGSGKTMLMRTIAGLVRPDSGTVTIDGDVLFRDVSFPPSVGALIENPAFIGARSGFDNLMLLARIKNAIGPDEVQAVLEEVGLKDAGKLKFSKYSLGMKQRLGLAAAIMESPRLLLLDEPSNALDVSGVEMLKRLVRKSRDSGATVIIASHDMALIEELSDRMFSMETGRIAEVHKG